MKGLAFGRLCSACLYATRPRSGVTPSAPRSRRNARLKRRRDPESALPPTTDRERRSRRSTASMWLSGSTRGRSRRTQTRLPLEQRKRGRGSEVPQGTSEARRPTREATSAAVRHSVREELAPSHHRRDCSRGWSSKSAKQLDMGRIQFTQHSNKRLLPVKARVLVVNSRTGKALCQGNEPLQMPSILRRSETS